MAMSSKEAKKQEKKRIQQEKEKAFSRRWAPADRRIFSLRDEPWISARYRDGSVKDVSLRQLFEDIDSVSGLDCDSAMQDVAILRFLTALCYDALGVFTYDDWAEIYGDGTVDNIDFPSGCILRYLNDNEDRFWLIHPEHPFMQQHDLRPASIDAPSNVSKLIQMPTNGQNLISRLHDEDNPHISFAEAARWLLATVCYDAASAHTGFEGDPNASSGRAYATKTLCGYGSQVFIQTGSLKKDLLLLLIPEEILEAMEPDLAITHNGANVFQSHHASEDLGDTEVSEDPTGTMFLPTWMKEDLTPEDTGTTKKKVRLQSMVDALTLRNRRVRLLANTDGTLIDGAFITSGVCSDATDAYALEPMCAWKKADDKANKDSVPHFVPIALSTDKAFWRGLPQILASREGLIKPLTLRWADFLVDEGLLDEPLSSLRVVTVRYDSSMSSSITDVFDAVRELPTSVFSQNGNDGDNAAASQTVGDAVELAESCVKDYSLFIRRCKAACGGEVKMVSTDVERSTVYSELGPLFYEWVLHMNMDEWKNILWETITRDADDYMQSLSLTALYGRGPFSSARAISALRGSLYKKLKE